MGWDRAESRVQDLGWRKAHRSERSWGAGRGPQWFKSSVWLELNPGGRVPNTRIWLKEIARSSLDLSKLGGRARRGAAQRRLRFGIGDCGFRGQHSRGRYPLTHKISYGSWVHTVEYDPFIKRELASRDEFWGLGHVTVEISTRKKTRSPSSSRVKVCDQL